MVPICFFPPLRSYTSRLGPDRVRLASMGEFSGWGSSPAAEVDAAFRRRSREQQPGLAGLMEGTGTKCGLRPFVNDGIILVRGKTIRD